MLAKLETRLRSIISDPGTAAKTALLVTVAGLATREAVVFTWRQFHGEEPPRDPTRPDVNWPTALGWTTAVGVSVGLARLLTRRMLHARRV